jgi:hypothetical protein
LNRSADRADGAQAGFDPFPGRTGQRKSDLSQADWTFGNFRDIFHRTIQLQNGQIRAGVATCDLCRDICSIPKYDSNVFILFNYMFSSQIPLAGMRRRALTSTVDFPASSAASAKASESSTNIVLLMKHSFSMGV